MRTFGPFDDELFVDNFAGGGGASLGIQWATGRSPDIAVNHDEDAIEMHLKNHPETQHFREDVWKVNPREVCGGKKVGIAWFSPDCRHFSRAKGGKPVSPRVRGLAWVAIRWAKEVAPRLIILENVREFQDWGPLIPKKDAAGKVVKDEEGNPCLIPDPTRTGQSFKRFVGTLRNLGYQVEWRDMNAADYGAPTNRRRLFLIARNDGAPIAWPVPTHRARPKDGAKVEPTLFAEPALPFHRSAAECIDWSIPCPSIFEREKELAFNTNKRLAHGLVRFVLNCKEPFLVCCNHSGEGFRGQSLQDPMCTVAAARDAHGLVVPTIVGVGGRMGQSAPVSAESPLPTACAKADKALMTPYLTRIGQNGSNGGHVQEAGQPLNTIVSKNEHLLVTPYLVQPCHGGHDYRAQSAQAPVNTIVGSNAHAVAAPTLESAAPFIATNTSGHPGASINSPLSTQTTGNHQMLIMPWIVKHYGGSVGVASVEPIPTTTARGTQNQIAAAYLVHFNHGEKQWSDAKDPLRTITAGGRHAAAVYAFLIKYYGTALGQSLHAPLGTQTGKDRFGLVMVYIGGEPYVIVDIGMRMLTSRELANAQGFPSTYILTGTKTSQVKRIGNSVCPHNAAAIVKANYFARARTVGVA
jgi:DNA (cytosine-5)-methyltransferase 1